MVHLTQKIYPVATEKEELIDALKYPGGFVKRIPLEVPAELGAKIYGFRIHVPSFCKGVSILEAGVEVGKEFVAAVPDRQDPAVFTFKLGANQTANRILVSLNGPEGSTCSLPIYGFGKW